VVDYVNHWKGRTEIPAKQILRWIGLYESTFYKWCRHYGKEYNEKRLHSGIGYITPVDMLAGRAKEIHEARDRKLAEARDRRRAARQNARAAVGAS